MEKIEITLQRKILEERYDPPGWLLSNLKGQEIGFFRDKDLNQLLKGKTIIRVVSDLDGYHGLETRETGGVGVWVDLRILKHEIVGEIRDMESFSLYPFRKKDELEITLIKEGDIVIINLILRPREHY